MASTDTTPVQTQRPTADNTPAKDSPVSTEDLGAGLDALDSVTIQHAPITRTLREKVLPPVIAIALVLGLWQLAFTLHLTDTYKLPSPAMVWHSLTDLWYAGTLFSIIWTSLWRGISGFLAAVAIGTPIGLLVARTRPVRAAIGPILSGLQSLPSVAWVPAAVIWLGINDSAMYAVILLGAVPSIANGLVSGIDQVPPLFLRAGRTMGATGLTGARHVLLPAALPGYLAGLKQGWAFSWRSLMAAELIASSPDLGLGLGRYLENRREDIDMPGVLLGIILILTVGIAIDLLVFSPIERTVLRSRGLLTTNR
ncbi:ABC transporter permease [Kitasatospora sp. NPDC001175]|uniref:ABC transporter permease n=1 Tax=Kitasatospora sp. NPDC001175 TaxID=3157103 RepID=UPI003D04C4E3